ncbi:MAG: hypothetical protein GOP50_04335 [Candidatus Heimdallarchaeota archaeon]|nr:hypothetical protein [Candidatus Heimdallarchaeota archaeon]
MNKKHLIKASTFLIFLTLALNPVTSLTQAQSGEYIAAFNGRMSDTQIVRNQVISIYATIVNFGDLTIKVQSLKVDFVHLGGNIRLNSTYTQNFDVDHYKLEPGASLTGTIRTEITNAEADYNVTIYFWAVDEYHPHPEIGAFGKKYIAAENITVSIVDYGGPSNVIIGIGIAFAVAVVGVIVFILYGWIRDKLKKRKY